MRELEWCCFLLVSAMYAGSFVTHNEGHFFRCEGLPCTAPLLIWFVFGLLVFKLIVICESNSSCDFYMEFLVVQSPSWLDANWNLGLSPETALPGAWSNMKARGSIFYQTLCSQQFLISTHHELSRGIFFSENGAIEGWDKRFFALSFISQEVEAGHKSTRMHIDFYSKPQRELSDVNWCTTEIFIRGILG